MRGIVYAFLFLAIAVASFGVTLGLSALLAWALIAVLGLSIGFWPLTWIVFAVLAVLSLLVKGARS